MQPPRLAVPNGVLERKGELHHAVVFCVRPLKAAQEQDMLFSFVDADYAIWAAKYSQKDVFPVKDVPVSATARFPSSVYVTQASPVPHEEADGAVSRRRGPVQDKGTQNSCSYAVSWVASAARRLEMTASLSLWAGIGNLGSVL